MSYDVMRWSPSVFRHHWWMLPWCTITIIPIMLKSNGVTHVCSEAITCTSWCRHTTHRREGAQRHYTLLKILWYDTKHPLSTTFTQLVMPQPSWFAFSHIHPHRSSLTMSITFPSTHQCQTTINHRYQQYWVMHWQILAIFSDHQGLRIVERATIASKILITIVSIINTKSQKRYSSIKISSSRGHHHHHYFNITIMKAVIN